MTQFEELSYAVRLPVVLKYFGQYCFVLSVLTLVPAVMAVLDASWWQAVCFGVLAIGSSTLGGLLARIGGSAHVQTNEAMVLVVGIFLFTSVVMTIPFLFEGLGFWEAWFESVSACTTTGLTTLATVENRSPTFLFTRAWMQWYGGLGIVVFSVAIVIYPGLTARRLMQFGLEQGSVIGNTRVHARRVLFVYGILTVIAIVGLLFFGESLFDSITIACAAVSTGGFAPYDASLAGLPGGWFPWMLTILFCFAGAVPLILYERVFRGDWGVVFRSTQLRMLVGLSCLTVIALFLCLWAVQHLDAATAMRQAPLLGISAQSTAGFSTLEVASLHPLTKLVLILAMSIGGGLGSSAGGMKVWRLIIVWRVLQLLIARTSTPPHAVLEPKAKGGRLENEETTEATMIVALFLVTIVLSWLPFVALGYDALDSLFEVVSATGTVGLSTGIACAELPNFLKLVLCCDMLLGRLEIFAFLVAFHPRSWLGHRSEAI